MRRRIVAGTLALLILACAGTIHFYFREAERDSGTLPHDVYVWQRRWDDSVTDAVGTARERASGFTVLVAEVAWQEGCPRTARVSPDYASLQNSGRPIGLALRVGPYDGSFDGSASAARLLRDLAASLISEAREAGVEPAELQIDFDCAESKLDGYRRWVEEIRTGVGNVPLGITALPCWLKRRAFARLAKVTDGYVLQVHSLERPKGPDDPMALCDPEKARRWAERAARIGVPFRVALPTYGYLVAFGRNGRFIGLCAEGPARAWKPGMSLRVVRSDPAALAKLVRAWRENRPAALAGIIWYRLPVREDSLNWRWPTLEAVMRGRTPAGNAQVRIVYPQPELAEVVVTNGGDADLTPEFALDLTWGRKRLVASDGLRGFCLDETGRRNARLLFGAPHGFAVIGPGESWKVAWLRFETETKVEADIVRNRP